MEAVREEWIKSGEIFNDIFTAAELYGVYEDLFRHGYFHPCLALDVNYSSSDGGDDLLTPVYRGNIVKPREASVAPEVRWSSGPEDVWCLAMTGPDTHLTEAGAEVVHWLVGTIRGCLLYTSPSPRDS